MTFTYDPTSITTDLAKVRFLIQDTSQATAKLSDEEIAFVVTEEKNVYLAAAACCDQIVASFGRSRNKQVGDLQIGQGGEVVTSYTALAKSLRVRAARHTTLTPVLTSLYVADKQANDEDDSLTSHAFSLGMDDNLRGSDRSSDDALLSDLD